MLLHVLARLRPQVGRIVINANGDPARFSGHCLPVIADSIEGYAGPLAGLHAGIEWARPQTPEASFIASVPVDCPFLPLDLVARLKAALIAKAAAAPSPLRTANAIPSPGCGASIWPRHWPDAQEERARAAPLRGFAGLRRRRFRARRHRRRHRPVLQRECAGRSGEGAGALRERERAWLGRRAHRHRRLEELRQDDAGRAPHPASRSARPQSGDRQAHAPRTCARRWRHRRRAARARRALQVHRHRAGCLGVSGPGRKRHRGSPTSRLPRRARTSSLSKASRARRSPRSRCGAELADAGAAGRRDDRLVIAVASDHAGEAAACQCSISTTPTASPHSSRPSPGEAGRDAHARMRATCGGYSRRRGSAERGRRRATAPNAPRASG